MIGTVGPKGQVVIPKEVRDRLGIRPGSSVFLVLREADGVLEIRHAWDDPIVDGPRAIRELIRRRGEPVTSATETLAAIRREDDALWLAQVERWTGTPTSSTPTRSSPTSRAKQARKRSPTS